MIAFLTLCYIAILFILVKSKVIKLNLWWKLSPLAWILLLLVVLFIPMQWGAPAGAVNIYQGVVEIIPNVSGEVIEVSAKPLEKLKQGDVLFKVDPQPFQDQVDKLRASLKLAKVNLKRAKELYAKRLGPEVDVDRFTAEVDQLTAQLETAKFELDETVVRAPGDGFVTGLSLRPGQRVANLPLRSWVSFVNYDLNRLAMGINQNVARHVKIGQQAEVTFKILPGKVFTATVKNIIPITAQGQLSPTGDVPLAPSTQDVPLPFGVILELDQDAFVKAGLEALDISRLPGGARGTGAIYTESGRATHLIRKVMVRMQAWINYVNPY
ncbi:MAG: efflux RND transporter periplasmic adaptor subunit [Pseudomonadota bacterium]|nr:MAG: efflux RND transporter periplasmic adaptor subunit [Pseudomonadota bacterium]